MDLTLHATDMVPGGFALVVIGWGIAIFNKEGDGWGVIASFGIIFVGVVLIGSGSSMEAMRQASKECTLDECPYQLVVQEDSSRTWTQIDSSD